MKAEVHYLNWDEPVDGDHNWDALEIKDGDVDPADLDQYRPVLTLYNVGSASDVWNRLNRGPGGYQEELDEVEERSMCVGDLIVLEGRPLIVRPVGFEEVDLDVEDAPAPKARGC